LNHNILWNVGRTCCLNEGLLDVSNGHFQSCSFLESSVIVKVLTQYYIKVLTQYYIKVLTQYYVKVLKQYYVKVLTQYYVKVLTQYYVKVLTQYCTQKNLDSLAGIYLFIVWLFNDTVYHYINYKTSNVMLILKDEQVSVTCFKAYSGEPVKSTKRVNKVNDLITGDRKRDLPRKVQGLPLSYLVGLV